VETERLRLRIEALDAVVARVAEGSRAVRRRRGRGGAARVELGSDGVPLLVGPARRQQRRAPRGRRHGQRGQSIRTIDYLAICAAEGRAPSSYARGLRYTLTAPMRASSRVLGTLSSWSAERADSRADEEFVTAVGSLLAQRLAASTVR
jgi:hypothetical protein